MEYLDREELRRLLSVAYERNKLHHLALLVGLWHGARVSEIVSLKGTDIVDGKISIQRLKRSLSTCQPLHFDKDKIFDESPLIALAEQRGTQELFQFSRQRVDQFIKKYAEMAGIHPSKAHAHALKHSCAMLIWDATQSLGMIQGYLGHKRASSTMCYLVESDKRKAEKAIAGIKL